MYMYRPVYLLHVAVVVAAAEARAAAAIQHAAAAVAARADHHVTHRSVEFRHEVGGVPQARDHERSQVGVRSGDVPLEKQSAWNGRDEHLHVVGEVPDGHDHDPP